LKKELINGGGSSAGDLGWERGGRRRSYETEGERKPSKYADGEKTASEGGGWIAERSEKHTQGLGVEYLGFGGKKHLTGQGQRKM